MKKLFIALKSPFVIFSVLLFLKLLYVRHHLFGGIHPERTIVAEMAAVLFVFGVVEAISYKWNKTKTLLYFAVSAVFSLILFSMIVYYDYYGTLVTLEALNQAGQVGEVKDSILSLIRPVYYGLFADLVLILALLLVKRNLFDHTSMRKLFQLRYVFVVLAVSIAACFGNVWSNKGQDIVNEMKKAEYMGLLNYEAYTAYADTHKKYKAVNVSMQKIYSLKKITQPLHPQYFGMAKGKHVFIIQLEAFQNFVVGMKIGGQEITPNLNKLKNESFYFNHFYSQIGKGNTSDAEFMTQTSIYPVGTKPMSQGFGDRTIPSMPRLMKDNGYVPITLHPNSINFWFRNLMYPAVGFERWYDKAYFGDEDVISFGASDEVLYRRSMDVFKKMDKQNQKIYASIISLSSHNPFKIPDTKPKLTLPGDLKNTFIGDYIDATHYADYALGTFIKQLKDAGMWDDSVLVIYGDHFGIGWTSPEDQKQLLSKYLGRTYNRADSFNVPLMMKVPGLKSGRTIEHVGGQMDTMPTLANLMGVPLNDHIVFGQDLLNQQHNLLGERFYAPNGTFINDDALFVPGMGYEDGTFTALPNRGKLLSPDAYKDDFSRMLKLMELSDAYVNNLPLRPMDNK